MIDILSGKICMGSYCLANPVYVYSIIPLFIVIFVLAWMNFVKFNKDEDKTEFVKKHRFDRIFFIIIRPILLLLLLIAIASPYTLKETTTQGNPSLTILADNSSSFGVFDTGVAPKLAEQLKEYFPVNLKYIASGERSAIGDGILQNAEGDDQILVISDGYNNYGRDLGDIILFSSILNTTIHTLKMEPIKKDVSVMIDGPSQVIEQSENSYRVYVNNIGDVDYNKVEVFIDGAPINLDSSGRFTWRFSKGYHKINARILFPKEDHFEQNNEFYMSVKSLPRPILLYVTSGSGGPMQQALEKVYEVIVQESIPDNLDIYDVTVLNNLHINQISDNKVDLISDYLSEKGKGLVVVGGDNSFDHGGYEDSYFESLLPVNIGVAERKSDAKYNVVFVIDLSGTVNYPFRPNSDQTVLDFEKSFLISIIRSLNIEDEVSIIGFVSRPHCVPQELHCVLNPISFLPNIEDSIRTFAVPAEDSGTNIALALNRARSVLEKAKGSKNVVLLTDGIDTNEYGIMQTVQSMSSFGVKLYTIGVGQFVNGALLKNMADKSGGLYFEPDESDKLKIIFMGDEEEQKCLKATSGRAVLMDTAHWITKGDLTLSANVGGYNLVVPELWGRKLVATDCDRTLITAGRYGLGRVAVMSTDDGGKWSGQLFSRDNSKVITKMVNWAIGDFTKDIEFDVRVKDTTLGKATDVNGLDFVKIDAGLYSAKFRPEKVGFYQLLGASVGVSYNDEYEKIGLNPALGELVTISGGKVFEPNDVEKIKDTIITMSKRVKIKTVNYRWPFVIAALILFLIEVFIRRLRQNKDMSNF
jgi:uncharacterized membrane protein